MRFATLASLTRFSAAASRRRCHVVSRKFRTDPPAGSEHLRHQGHPAAAPRVKFLLHTYLGQPASLCALSRRRRTRWACRPQPFWRPRWYGASILHWLRPSASPRASPSPPAVASASTRPTPTSATPASLAEGDPAAARPHLARAGALIAETGYHRRDGELAELDAASR